jgi:hypothetical protein
MQRLFSPSYSARPLALLLILLSILLLVHPSSADSGWDFRGAKSKAEAMEKALAYSEDAAAQSSSALPSVGDDGSADTAALPLLPQWCTTAMFQDWAEYYNKTFTEENITSAYLNFCENMKDVMKINLDPNVTFW